MPGHYFHNPGCRTGGAVQCVEREDPLMFKMNTRARARIHSTTLKQVVAKDLADMRYEHGLEEKDIQRIKVAVQSWVDNHLNSVVRALDDESMLAPGISRADAAAKLSCDLFAGLRNSAQEMAQAKKELPFLEPRIVYPSAKGRKLGEPIVSFDVAKLLARRIQNDKGFRQKILAASDEMKKGDRWRVTPTVLNNMMDGVGARWHPRLLRPAGPGEEKDVRIALIFNCDDIETVGSGLNPTRGVHKQCGCQLAVCSLDTDERFKPENILLPAMSRASVYKKYGMARVLAGVDKDGTKHAEPNFAADMRELDKGVWIEIPDDVNGGTRSVRLCAWVVCNSADMLASNSLLPCMESTSAWQYCRHCDHDKREPYNGRAFSFLRQTSSEPGAAKGPTLLNWPSMQKALASLRQRRAWKGDSSLGFNKAFFAMDPEYVPHVSPTEDFPEDALHLGPDGLLRSEAAWLIHQLAKMGLKTDTINAAIDRYPDFPADCRIPHIHQALEKGIKGGTPKATAMLRMTGSQVMHFSEHRCASRFAMDLC